MLSEWGTRTRRRQTSPPGCLCSVSAPVATDVSCVCLWFKRTLSISFPSPSTTICILAALSLAYKKNTLIL